jgi:hypothetical protein
MRARCPWMSFRWNDAAIEVTGDAARCRHIALPSMPRSNGHKKSLAACLPQCSPVSAVQHNRKEAPVPRHTPVRGRALDGPSLIELQMKPESTDSPTSKELTRSACHNSDPRSKAGLDRRHRPAIPFHEVALCNAEPGPPSKAKQPGRQRNWRLKQRLPF